MDVLVAVDGRDRDHLVALNEWLNAEDQLRGRIRPVSQPIQENELGTVADALTVALATGGAGSVLASSLITWLKTRQTSAKVTVKSGRRSVTLDIQTIEDVEPLLRQLLLGEASGSGDEG
ncbi:hypothetical protein AB0H76_35100 [Nocardia sp. NPDC050712]|uniref:effector-associated constant component EACC1 n=1 Tax=Nocardia sp. NPDC050712 TaxID=3155518 RepID=UPI0033D11855